MKQYSISFQKDPNDEDTLDWVEEMEDDEED